MTTEPEAAVEVLRSRGIVDPVELAIGVGPQLGALAENLENAIGVAYSDLPGFPAIDKSHGEGRFIVSTLEGTRVACLQGRSHFYETGDPTLMAAPLESLAMLGVSNLLIASTAASVNADFLSGSTCLDHRPHQLQWPQSFDRDGCRRGFREPYRGLRQEAVAAAETGRRRLRRKRT